MAGRNLHIPLGKRSHREHFTASPCETEKTLVSTRTGVLQLRLRQFNVKSFDADILKCMHACDSFLHAFPWQHRFVMLSNEITIDRQVISINLMRLKNSEKIFKLQADRAMTERPLGSKQTRLCPIHHLVMVIYWI